MNILFVCKYNRFRSRIAKAYFDKINKKKSIVTKSAGIFPEYYPLDKTQLRIAKKFGIDIRGRPKGLSYNLVRWANTIVIVADDVQKRIFKDVLFGRKKIIKWVIEDVRYPESEKKKIEKIIKKIIKKIDKFAMKLR